MKEEFLLTYRDPVWVLSRINEGGDYYYVTSGL